MHSSWLPAFLKNQSLHDIGEEDKPLLPRIQLCTYAKRLSIKETILPVCREYFRRLFSDPACRYLYNFRTFAATKSDNESVLFRNITRLFCAAPPTVSGGAPINLSFRTYQHRYNLGQKSALMSTIKDAWLEHFVPDTMAASATEVGQLRTAASIVMLLKLDTYHLNVIALFNDDKKYKYDCVLMDLVDEYFKLESTFASNVRAPIAPFLSSKHVRYRGGPIYKAVKSKLRSRPLQEALSSYILGQCQCAIP